MVDGDTGQRKWFYAGGLDTGFALGADGTLYVGDAAAGTFNALDSTTGLREWSFLPPNVLTAPAIAADGTIYFGSNDGNVYAIGQ